MGAGLTIVLSVLIICIAVVFICYLGFSSDNKTGIFSDLEHEKRIRRLENLIDELQEEK